MKYTLKINGQRKNSLDIKSLKAHFDMAYELAFSRFIIRFVDGVLFSGSQCVLSAIRLL